MGMVHISHFTNQETVTEALSLVISSKRTGVEPRTAHTGTHSEIPWALLEEGVTAHATHVAGTAAQSDTKIEP